MNIEQSSDKVYIR